MLSKMAKGVSVKKLRNRTLKSNSRKHVPLPTGPFQKIGCRDFMCGLSRKNGVLLRLFYPAKMDSSKPFEPNPMLWANWLPHHNYRIGYGDVANIQNKFLRWLIDGTHKSNVFIPAIPNCKPHVPEKKFPVVVFSHGLGGCRTTYSAICTELASHGFVVAAVEHRDNSACLSFYPRRATYSLKSSNPDFFNTAFDQVDGEDEKDFGDEVDDPNYIPPKALEAMTSIPQLEMCWVRHRSVPINKVTPDVYQFRNRQIHQRVRECTRALDLIEALNAGYEVDNLLDPSFNVHEFENMLDLEKLTIMGHSFGGATALMAAAAEIRFKVAVVLDAWMFPIREEPLDLISQPAIFINTDTMANWTSNKKRMVAVVQGENVTREEREAIDIVGSKHMQQSDAPYVFGFLSMLLSGSYSRNALNSIDVHDLTTCLSLQFISKYLDIEIDERINAYVKEQRKHLRSSFK